MIDLGTRGGRLGAALAVSIAMLGCGEQDTKPVGDVISSDGILVCGPMWELLMPGAEEPPNEWYSVTAMHNKLRHYPDFAAMAGVESVSNCEQARFLYDRYEEYQALHPGFDRHEPIDVEALPTPPLPDADPYPAEVLEEPKLKNGSPDMLIPVVGITNARLGCTATFIARNFAITASHCLEVAPGFVAGTDPESAAKVHKWYKYTVSFAGPGGVVSGDVRSYKYVLQYNDPRYLGFRAANSTGASDFALLYFLDTQDNLLPNNLPNESGSRVPFLRVSRSLAVSNTSATVWGFGLPNQDKLERGIVNNYNIHAVLGSPSAVLEGPVPSGTGVPYICHGDSGGPLVDRYDIPNPTTGVPEPQYVAVGVTADWRPRPTGDCADATGYTIQWAPTEEERNFIGDAVASWYPHFRCNDKRSANATGADPDYFECWGKPCKDTVSDCSAGEVCVHPGKELTSCAGCSSSGSCDCIFGQCLKTDG